MTHLDLCSGIGGFALAAQWAGFETIGFSEIDEYASRVLAAHWPNVRNYGDIRKLTGVSADLVTAGFPCQPFSVAGERRGKDDDRHLWPEVRRVISEAGPAWVLCENVAGIDGLALEDCITDLELEGYEVAPPLEIPACAVGATHVRNRVWILAYSERQGRKRHCQNNGVSVAERKTYTEFSDGIPDSWSEVVRFGRDLRERDGLSCAMVRRAVKAYGNSIVPQVAYQILKTVAQVEEKVSDSETG